MNRTLRLALLLSPLALGACFPHVRAEHVLTGAPAAAHSGPVKVVMEGAPDPGPFDEIGIVTATGSGSQATLPEVIAALQKEAATLGADAVIRVRYDNGASSATATGVAVRMRAP